MGRWTCIETKISDNNSVYKRKEIIFDEVFPAKTAFDSGLSDELKVKKQCLKNFGFFSRARHINLKRTANEKYL